MAGSSLAVPLLGTAAAILLGAKLVATAILLRRNKQERLRSRSGRWLWWTTKLTPVVAVPCMIAVAVLRHRAADAAIYLGLLLFVLIAVPVMIWRNRAVLRSPLIPRT